MLSKRTFTGTVILGNAHNTPCHLYDPVDVLQCMVHTYSTEGDLVLMDFEVIIHELLVDFWIRLLQGLHLELQGTKEPAQHISVCHV